MNNTLKRSVGIVTIATGPYANFFAGWYETAKMLFLPDLNRKFYLVTDAEGYLPYCDQEDLTCLQVKHEPWPNVALRRWEYLLRLQSMLSMHTYTVFMQANLRPLRPIRSEQLSPGYKYDGLFAVHHCDFKPGKHKHMYEYERNPDSTACIVEGQGEVYYQSGFFGGYTEDVLEMCAECYKWTEQDMEKGIVPVWHDESYFNKYLLDKKPLILDGSQWLVPSYEIQDVYSPRYIIYQLDKSLFMDVKSFKGK